MKYLNQGRASAMARGGACNALDAHEHAVMEEALGIRMQCSKAAACHAISDGLCQTAVDVTTTTLILVMLGLAPSYSHTMALHQL